MDELHRAVAPFIHSLRGGLPGGSMGHSRGAPFDVGFFAGNENADPSDMGAVEQHQNIAKKEWDELRSCASRGEPASSGVAFHPKHTTAIVGQPSQENLLISRIKEDLLNPPSLGTFPRLFGYLVLLLPSLTSKGKGVKLNASLAHSERISALAEVEKGMRKKKRS
ncbi:hypothetical protein Tco_1066324 [Tanacetum coccineum]|uniref:Uncharacterized protein n=1 Tax=Tanacetum coccineum TaxID=301880 RepID=A0ABQ5HBI3_9ASTR